MTLTKFQRLALIKELRDLLSQGHFRADLRHRSDTLSKIVGLLADYPDERKEASEYARALMTMGLSSSTYETYTSHLDLLLGGVVTRMATEDPEAALSSPNELNPEHGLWWLWRQSPRAIKLKMLGVITAAFTVGWTAHQQETIRVIGEALEKLVPQ